MDSRKEMGPQKTEEDENHCDIILSRNYIKI